MNSVILVVGGRQTELFPVHYLRPQHYVIPATKANLYGAGVDGVDTKVRWVLASAESMMTKIFKYELYAAMVYSATSEDTTSRTRRLLVTNSRMFFVKNTSPPEIEDKYVLMHVGESRCAKRYVLLIIADSITGEIFFLESGRTGTKYISLLIRNSWCAMDSVVGNIEWLQKRASDFLIRYDYVAALTLADC